MRKALRFSLFIFLLLLPGGAGAGHPALTASAPALVLQVADDRDGRIYYTLPITADAFFSVEFLHSYDRVPYWDEYQVNGKGELIHRRSGGRSLLNGQGFFYPGFRILPGGSWEIGGINEIRDCLLFIMGTPGDADHLLKLNGRTIRLSEKIVSGRVVRVSIQQSRLYKEGR